MAVTETPLVSILIRSMDRPTLVRALDSAAAQTWLNLEIVVVAACGAAHRPLPDTWKGRPLRLIFPGPDRHLPRPDAANASLEAARGEWLNFLDDDDEFLPEHIATLLAAPRMRDERVVYSSPRMIDAGGKQVPFKVLEIRAVGLYFGNFGPPCQVLFHRSLIEEGARFDPAFPVYEDYDFYVALATRTPFRFVDAVTVDWHAESGDSGCGIGANSDSALRDTYFARLREKWRSQFDIWLQDADALLFTAEQFALAAKDTLALDCLDRVLRLRPDDLRASTLKLELLHVRKQIDALLRKGHQHLCHGSFDIALACFQRVLALRHNDVNALNLAGVALLNQGRLDEAEHVLALAAKEIPQHQGIQDNLSLVRKRLAARGE